ncbi:MAG: hypothetical protein Q7S84_04430 [bacterium]|nr:hypothetical protein [bacterium]
MLWLFTAIASYLLLAVVVVGDAFLLKRAFPDPKLYAFSVGVLGLLVLLGTPFFGFPVPNMETLFLALLAGVASLFGILVFYRGIKLYEASRMAPATGGLLPLLTLVLGSIVASETRPVSELHIIAITLLAVGTFAITLRRSVRRTFDGFGAALLAASLFAILFVTSKVVYLRVSFWPGFLWVTIGIGVGALALFAASSTLRRDVLARVRGALARRPVAPPSSGSAGDEQTKHIGLLFLLNQFFGAASNILQNLAVYLAPAGLVAAVPALQGVEYLAVIGITAVLAKRAPSILAEGYRDGALAVKLGAVVAIALGIALISFAS